MWACVFLFHPLVDTNTHIVIWYSRCVAEYHHFTALFLHHVLPTYAANGRPPEALLLIYSRHSASPAENMGNR